MNLELIKRYEKEFLHMLHGGKLMFKPNNKQVWFDSVTSPIDWTVDGLYVIDDIYCTYRIALAEGKIIEERYYTPVEHWGKHLSGFAVSPEMLRIKPEETEFKVGDYVRYIHTNSPKPLQIINIHCERYYFENAEIILRLDEIEKWEPREGETCIFWDNYTKDAFISKFSGIANDGTYISVETAWWDNCMPFTGVLPPHMGESK